MVRRFYIAGGNNPGDPAVGSNSITDTFFENNTVHGIFKEGFRYYIPGSEWIRTGDTVTVVGGYFDLGEVIIVEVGPKMSGIICAPGGQLEFREIDPYLPDIIKCVVARVNTTFETRADDPFSVHYDRGLYQQVGNDRLNASIQNTGFILVWLVMPFREDSVRDDSYYADATCEVFIATPSEANYTQQEREDKNFYPRLMPVYKQFIEEIKNETKLNNSFGVEHTRTLLPYWGGGDVAGPGQPNLWKNYADCIKVSNLRLKIEHTKNCEVLSSFI